jgi:hypothetical protein
MSDAIRLDLTMVRLALENKIVELATLSSWRHRVLRDYVSGEVWGLMKALQLMDRADLVEEALDNVSKAQGRPSERLSHLIMRRVGGYQKWGGARR